MFIRHSIFVVLFFIFSSVSLAQTPAGVDLSWNDRLVMHAMRSFQSAEMAYQATAGNGTFGSLLALSQQELIDPVLASGVKHGYRFTVTIQHASTSRPGGFELRATPIIRRPRYFSFYINEACEIRGADKQGRDASINDPVIEPCGASQLSENERLSIGSLRTIHGAQMTYAATYGAGNYGTFAQLYDSNLVVTGFVLVNIYRGYSAQMTVTPTSATLPPRFSVTIIPQQYGRSGIRSFYVDESGVIRGADKHGEPAGPNDPPINN